MDKSKRQLGWSMTKGWLCTIIGRMIKNGLLPQGLETKVDIPEWKEKPGESVRCRCVRPILSNSLWRRNRPHDSADAQDAGRT